MRARGEDLTGNMASNGEAALQRAVFEGLADRPFVQVVDIGANRGAWTLSLLQQAAPQRRTAARLRVDLFEPVPSTRDVLSTAMRTSGHAAYTHIHAAALSDTTGSSRMARLTDTGGTNTLHADDRAVSPPGKWIDVSLTTLDIFCRDHAIDRIHLAKCDAEGHDPQILRGALPLLCAGRIDVFQFEYNHCWVFARAFLRDVFALIDGLPYALARVTARGIEVHDAWHPELERFFQANYALVHCDALRWFAVRKGVFTNANTLS